MILLDSTEVVKDSLNPKFKESIILDYFFERRQILEVKVYDVDADRRQPIGSLQFALGDVVGSRGYLVRDLVAAQGISKPGKIVRRLSGVSHCSSRCLPCIRLRKFMAWRLAICHPESFSRCAESS